MFRIFRQPSSSCAASLKPMAGIATALLLTGWAAGAGAQGTSQPAPPPVPPAPQSNPAQNSVPLATTPLVQAPADPQQQHNPNFPPLPPGHGAQGNDAQGNPAQSSAPPAQAPAAQPLAAAQPPQPLGSNDVRELQNQLIALGFEPGAADGVAGPATQAAAQQYDQSRGGNGQVSIDSVLLARLKADPGQRLTYDQVEARSHSSYQAQAPALGASQIGGIIQQLAPLIGAAINSSNNANYGNYGGYYGYGGYPGPGYYGPPPVYGGYGYGRW